MTNEEINEAVARKLGSHKIFTHKVGAGCENKTYCTCDGGLAWLAYSTSIEAAWEIVEHVNADKFELIKTSGFSTWGCAFKFQPGYPEDKTVTTYSSAADTAPLAICQAFLKLRED